MRKNNLHYTEYNDIFLELLNSGKELKTTPGRSKKIETLAYDENRCWKQCYAPDDEARKYFPKYWFVSNDGYIASVSPCVKKVQLLKRLYNKNGYCKYCWGYINEDGKYVKKVLSAHLIVGLVFGCDVFEPAKERLAEKGIYSFGTYLDGLQGHHIDKDKNNHKPTNIQIIPTKYAKIVDNYPEYGNKEKSDANMCKLARYVYEDKINKPVVAATGNVVDKDGNCIEDCKKCYLSTSVLCSEEVLNQLQDEMDRVKRWGLMESVLGMVYKERQDYFLEPKYLVIVEQKFVCKCVQVDDKIMAEQVRLIDIPKDADYIWCRWNKDGYAEAILK